MEQISNQPTPMPTPGTREYFSHIGRLGNEARAQRAAVKATDSQ